MVHVDFSEVSFPPCTRLVVQWARHGQWNFPCQVTPAKDLCLLHWSEIQTCIHLNFYFYIDLLLKILFPIQQLLVSALNMVSQKKTPLVTLQSITVTGSIQILGKFGLGNVGFCLWSTFSDPEGWSPGGGGTANETLAPKLQLNGGHPSIFTEAPKRSRQENPIVSWHLWYLHLTGFMASPLFVHSPLAQGALFHRQGNFKWLQRAVLPYVPPVPCLRCLCLLPFVVIHAADKTSGIQGVLSKTMRAKIARGSSQHDNKHTLFSRHVSVCFLFTLAGQGGATLLFV